MYRFAYLLRGTSTPACSLRNNNPVESERPHKWVVNSDLFVDTVFMHFHAIFRVRKATSGA